MHDPGDPRPRRRARRHRGRRRARRPQVHGVPAARHAREPPPGRADQRPRQATASASASCGSPAPPPPGSTWCRRRARLRASSPPTPARPSTSPCAPSESALYLDQVAGSSALQSHNWVGQHIPLHATSNGKVLLSELAEHELDAALPAPARATPTRRSPRGAAARGARRAYGELGYALAVDELEVGLTAAAAPIRSAHGDIIASMSISGPTFRLTSERLAEARADGGRGRARGLAPPRLGAAQLTGLTAEPPAPRSAKGRGQCHIGRGP